MSDIVQVRRGLRALLKLVQMHTDKPMQYAHDSFCHSFANQIALTFDRLRCRHSFARWAKNKKPKDLRDIVTARINWFDDARASGSVCYLTKDECLDVLRGVTDAEYLREYTT